MSAVPAWVAAAGAGVAGKVGAGGTRGAGTGGTAVPRRGRRGPGTAVRATGLEQQHQRAFGDLVADLDLHFPDGAGGGRGHVQRRLVRFQRDQRVLGLDDVARLDVDLDDRHVLEVADVGNFDFHHDFSPARRDRVRNDRRPGCGVEFDAGGDARLGDLRGGERRCRRRRASRPARSCGPSRWTRSGRTRTPRAWCRRRRCPSGWRSAPRSARTRRDRPRPPWD